MSEREFEHYLSLLGSLLRLRGGQRAEIAEELRQHLDERLADLQAAGLSRDDAIQQALAGGSTTSRESQRNAELLKMDTQFSRVSKLLQVQVDPDSWEENGGVGNVSAVNSILLIRQTERNHRRLRKLFDDLERITQ